MFGEKEMVSMVVGENGKEAYWKRGKEGAMKVLVCVPLYGRRSIYISLLYY